MRIVADVLSLRPIWIRRALEAIWYACLVMTLVRIGSDLRFSYSTVFAVGTTYVSLVSPFLFALVHLALLRIALEIALNLLVKPHEEALTQRT